MASVPPVPRAEHPMPEPDSDMQVEYVASAALKIQFTCLPVLQLFIFNRAIY
jgi:hypothetical protein